MASASIVLGILAAILIFAEYSARETVSGYLTPRSGLVKIFPPRPGTIQQVLVSEGEPIKKGQHIATISLEQSLDEGSGYQTTLISELELQQEHVRQQIENERKLAVAERLLIGARLSGLRDELHALESQERTTRLQVSSSDELHARAQSLLQQGFITAVDVQQKRLELLEVLRDLEALQVQIAGVRSRMQETELLSRQGPARLQQRIGPLESDFASAHRQIIAVQADRSYMIVAPVAGRVTALQAKLGKQVSGNQPLAAIVPLDTPLEAHLLVPSQAIGFVQVGNEVALRYAAFPYQLYGIRRGHVSAVSETTLPPSEWGGELMSPSEPVYRVTVLLQEQAIRTGGRHIRLQSGMLLSADILLEERAVWRWLFGPLLALRTQS